MLDLLQPGAYARTAGGNLERPDIQAPVIKWMAWSLNTDNGGGGGTAVWDRCRAKWDAAGIAEFPWMHVRSMADLQRLLSVGEGKNSPAIGVNIENVVGDKLSLQEVGGYLLDFWVNRYEKPVHMATLDWVQNGQGWQYMSFAVAALEFFPGEGNMKQGYSSVIAHQCLDHAHSEGLTKVTPMFKTGGQFPATYGSDFSLCHSLYTADDITPSAPAWNAWKGSVPCTPFEGEDVLTPTQKKKFREQITRFALVAEKYDSVWHYTQNRPYTGLGVSFSNTHYNDCSSYAALLFFAAEHAAHVSVADPLGCHYSGSGNTDTALNFLMDHHAPKDKYRVGDIAIYGTKAKTEHMTICRKSGTGTTAIFSSFGRESGPEGRQDVNYHPDPLIGIYRPKELL